MNHTTYEQGVKKREEILRAIITYISENGFPPTIQEIGEKVRLQSKSSVYNHLIKLEKEGKIKYGNGPRKIQIVGYKFVQEEGEDG